MSGKLMGACYNLRLKRGQRDVLMAYANFADDSGVCWPSNETVAWMCDITARHVQRIKQELHDLDLLHVVENPQGGRYQITVYQINVDGLSCPSSLDLQKPRKGDSKGDTITSPFVEDKGDTTMQKGDVLEQWATSLARKDDAVMSDNPDTVMSPDPSVDPSAFDPALNPSLNPSASSTSETEEEEEEQQQEELRRKQTIETCKRRVEQFASNPTMLKLIIDTELGSDEQARAEFEEWLARENESKKVKTASA